MKALLIEDELKLARAIRSGLELDGYVVEHTPNGEDALLFLENDKFDVVILDRMLEGDLDGVDVCQAIRSKDDSTPIIMLTALNEISDRISGLNQGADDYLGKPFDFEELLARLRALIRRPQKSVGPIITHDLLSIDTSTKEVSLLGKTIKLSKKEYSLLEFLLLNPGLTLSKEQIIERVWDFDADILPNTVEATVKNIRKKMKSDEGSYDIIETVRGFGYRVNAKVGTDV